VSERCQTRGTFPQKLIYKNTQKINTPNTQTNKDISHTEHIQKKNKMTLRLTYFNSRGRAEVARLICAEAKIAFEDNRIAQDAWGQLKATTPFGQLPVLDVGDVRIAQSGAIVRYLARIGNLYGASPVEAARIDMLAEGMAEVGDGLGKIHYGPGTADEKKVKMAAFLQTDVPKWMTNLTNLLKQNNEGKEFFVGNNVSLADVAFVRLSEALQGLQADILANFPLLKALADRISARPNLSAYIKSNNRPPAN